MTRVLVGILYCGENEFDECINSIQRQELVGVDYFVVENLPNKEAHNVLYENFMRNASNFDYFIKVDADMVLCKNTFFSDVISEMNEDLSFDNYQIAVLDHYTNSLIYGLHIYRNKVTWNISNSTETT